ncbi:heterokaryon incompatibility protein-domain-containing protein [Xylaria grammica]|nr:heterokaryon incompatibility protein-domain-containing protein [Xylaria grammica]
MSQFGLAMPASNEGLGYPREIQGYIGDALVQSSFGGKFLPESSLLKVVDKIDFDRLLPEASKDLIHFIQTKALRVFLTALLSVDLPGPSLVEVARSFEKNRLTDKNLPVKDITKRGRCLHPDSYIRCRCAKCSRACEERKGDCRHDPAMNSFHMKEWGRISFENFLNKQWIFFAPVFKKHNLLQFEKELPKETILPFTWKDPKPRIGHFSNVFHAKLHIAHQDECDPNGTEDLDVALKELKNTLSEETDYNPEKSWWLEVTALNELSELKDNHLIHPISAFKWHATHYIMFQWADGGTLRNFWDETRDAHLGLNKQRIGEFLEQLCGLAGALNGLHGTNKRTATGLAEEGMKSKTSPGGGSQSLNDVGMATVPQPSTLKVDPHNGVPSGPADGPIATLSSEDGDGDVKHWRHGDLKPDNILVFKDSTWLGTLKIADLGLAKQHRFATEFRHQVTSTKHATLHYEAPEAVTNMKEPRSRRYDIWSMGCIILESIIWLLYGAQGLDKFYRENKRVQDYTRQTLYFTTSSHTTDSGSELVASVSEIAMHWITEMLEKDPECKQYTALRQLLELVKNRLLVVAIPSNSRPKEDTYRATAGELYNEVDKIRITANREDEYIFTGTDRREVETPSPFIASKKRIPKPKTAQSQGHLGVHNSLAHDSYPHAMLDIHWEFFEDDLMSAWAMENKGFNNSLSVSPGTTTVCERCLTLDFGSLGLIASEQFSFLKSSAEVCPLCRLFLSMLRISSTDIAEIWRVKGGLAERNGGAPVLSIYRAPSANIISGRHAPGIPIGFPKLPEISSQTYFQILRQWLEDCDNNHAGCCLETAEASPTRMPTRLIDVEGDDSQNVYLFETQHSQISQVQHFKYAALSHPWGDKAEHSHYCTTRENITHHKAGLDIDTLPRTFKDAIRATRGLGVRYLWIDSLCIIQGEGGDFEEEAKHMETVFSSAYCVIAATCAGGASSGFLQSRPDRTVIKLEKPGEPPLYVCDSIDNFQRDVIEGTLNKRGWVLQERALARRTIYFAKNQTYWECGEGVRCETLMKMRNNQAALLGDPKFPKIATDSSKGGRIRLYELLYKQYSKLQFTRSYDRPLAIAGLEQRLIRAFDTQGGYGVFTRYFGRGLLWQRDTALAPQVMKPIQFPKSQRYQVPSWSWMAYEGAITFMDLPFGEIDWEDKEVRSPWSPPIPVSTLSLRPHHSSNATWYTTNTREKIDLTVVARDFSASADNHIVYDGGERPTDQTVKCVIVGRRKMKAGVDARRIHYVLVIAQKRGAGRDAGYKRIGVGALPGSSITLEEAGLQVQVF